MVKKYTLEERLENAKESTETVDRLLDQLYQSPAKDFCLTAGGKFHDDYFQVVLDRGPFALETAHNISVSEALVCYKKLLNEMLEDPEANENSDQKSTMRISIAMYLDIKHFLNCEKKHNIWKRLGKVHMNTLLETISKRVQRKGDYEETQKALAHLEDLMIRENYMSMTYSELAYKLYEAIKQPWIPGQDKQEYARSVMIAYDRTFWLLCYPLIAGNIDAPSDHKLWEKYGMTELEKE